MLGVSEATLYRWKGSYPEFREALRVGAREANGEVLNSAFQQSVGYYALQREAMKLKKVAARENAEGILEIVKDIKGNRCWRKLQKSLNT
jgi:transposase